MLPPENRSADLPMLDLDNNPVLAEYWFTHAKAMESDVEHVQTVKYCSDKLFGQNSILSFLNLLRIYDPDMPWRNPQLRKDISELAPQTLLRIQT
jgi:hypothetical protein